MSKNIARSRLSSMTAKNRCRSASGTDRGSRFGSHRVWRWGKPGQHQRPLTRHSNGYVEAGSLARYAPFGAWREEPTTNPTISDRGYTGHRHNNTGADDLGLIYMRARFYVPSIGRFASADTIVPEPKRPQSFNRFAYVENNPINFNDPSGHCKGRGMVDACLIDGGPEVSIGMYQWYEEYAPIQRWQMSDDELALFADSLYEEMGRDGSWENYSGRETQDIEDVVFPDTVIFPAVSASGTGPYATVGGAEVVGNFDTGEVSLFTYMGQGSGVGLEADASTYLGFAWNLEQNTDYEGIFHTLTVEASFVEGVQFSFFWEGGSVPFTGETWGFSAGHILLGGGASGAYSETNFHCRLGC